MEVVVARIGRPHGIKGEVSVEVRTDEPERRLGPGVTVRTDPATAGPLTITTGRVHSGRLLLTFEGVTDRSGAESLRGVLLELQHRGVEKGVRRRRAHQHEKLRSRADVLAGALDDAADLAHLRAADRVLVVGDPREARTHFQLRQIFAVQPAQESLAVLVRKIVPGRPDALIHVRCLSPVARSSCRSSFPASRRRASCRLRCCARAVRTRGRCPARRRPTR